MSLRSLTPASGISRTRYAQMGAPAWYSVVEATGTEGRCDVHDRPPVRSHGG
jgi:hypothetical protein